MNRALTMIELMFVIAILVFVIAGLLVSFVNCLTLNEHNLKFSIAMNLARQIMETAYYHRSDWDLITNYSYNEAYMSANYSVQGYSAAVIVTPIDNPNPQTATLKEVTVVICWRAKGGRIIGEDDGAGDPAEHPAEQLNGSLDAGEDRDVNGRLSSPCELTAAIAKR